MRQPTRQPDRHLEALLAALPGISVQAWLVKQGLYP